MYFQTMTDWCGKVVLITGANAGIGKATAIHFAKQKVGGLILVARNEDKLRDVAKMCHEVNDKVDVLVIAKDLTAYNACEDVVEKATDHFKG